MPQRCLSVAIIFATFTVPAFTTRRTAAADLAADLEKVAASAPGTLGLRVLHVESGDGASVNGREWFPMMSVYKLPIAPLIDEVKLPNADEGDSGLRDSSQEG